MVTCNVCNSQNFDKHDGFLYCSICLTQSQDYYEQEYDYQHHEVSTTRIVKSKIKTKVEKSETPEDGSWTSWEAFNYILHGMTQEVKKCGAEDSFEVMVLKIWAAYLRTCEVAFISKNSEKLPRLGITYKKRDARILYKVDVPLNFLMERKRVKRSSSRVSDVSSSSLHSKRSLALQKSKIIAADYQDYLSSSLGTKRSLADETLESLNNTGTETESSADDTGSIFKSFKQMMKRKDYRTYKSSYQSSRLLANAKANAEKGIDYLGKNKLLSMIHLGLLMTGSIIQLSDLLRFIREGHLSYAKVTHFLPAKVKVPKKDTAYIDVISDSYMPTHLRQRKITGQLGRLLKIENIPTPNIEALIDRYCNDLNLPDEVAKLSRRIARDYWPSTVIPKSRSPLPSFEAWAMVSIIFIMKLLFGVNDRTEIVFSKLAQIADRMKEGEVFAFEDWQNYIECRKSILTERHYPTQEQLNDSSYTSSKKFLEMLMKESKDEYRNDRFIPYSHYYMEESLVSGLKDLLQQLSKTQDLHLIDFKPSLTPQVSNLETILKEPQATNEKMKELPVHFLRRTFKHCNVQVFMKPLDFLCDLKETKPDVSEILEKYGVDEEDSDDVFHCSSNYWILHYPNSESSHLTNFKEEVFKKTPRNFQWLLKECSRMLEMNMRDVYDDLLRLEEKMGLMKSNIKGVRRKKRRNK